MWIKLYNTVWTPAHEWFISTKTITPDLDVNVKLNETRMHSSRMRTAPLYHTEGLPDRDLPLDRALSWQRHPQTETPRQRLPRQGPPRQRHPWTETPLDRDPLDRDPPDRDPPANRIIDRCKNITFPQLRLRAVINVELKWKKNEGWNRSIISTLFWSPSNLLKFSIKLGTKWQSYFS